MAVCFSAKRKRPAALLILLEIPLQCTMLLLLFVIKAVDFANKEAAIVMYMSIVYVAYYLKSSLDGNFLCCVYIMTVFAMNNSLSSF